MSRSVKAHEYAQKRNAILDIAQRYITTKGYEQMTTQDLLEALQISRGAFYHYFESKQALLMALVERIGEQAEQLLLPIISDHAMPAQALPRPAVRTSVRMTSQGQDTATRATYIAQQQLQNRTCADHLHTISVLCPANSV